MRNFGGSFCTAHRAQKCPEKFTQFSPFSSPSFSPRLPPDSKICRRDFALVYIISGPVGGGFLYATGAEAANSAVNSSKQSVPPLFWNQSSIPSTLPSYFLDFPAGSLFCSRPPNSQFLQGQTSLDKAKEPVRL